ncbi:hypothetical protein ABWF31_02980 [Arthrobacter psychrochitiniphilus]
MKQIYPVVIIGAGAAIREWGHSKLFSTWRYNIDAAARRLLETSAGNYAGGWETPRETRLPTGAELVPEYLQPLANHPVLAPVISYGHRVIHITRVSEDGKGVDKTRTQGREDSLFLIRTETEANDAGFITSPLPDPLSVDRDQFSGKTILVLGAGHSAANTLINLGRLRQQSPGSTILWGLRGTANPVRLFGGGAVDQLPARGQLGTSLGRFVDNGDITIVENASVASWLTCWFLPRGSAPTWPCFPSSAWTLIRLSKPLCPGAAH